MDNGSLEVQHWFQSTRPRGRTRPSAVFAIFAVCWFQSTRPRGRTRLFNASFSAMTPCFNPRVLAGGRDSVSMSKRIFTVVSIHASSREDATSSKMINKTRNRFNPRVLAGGRDNVSYNKHRGHLFQSTRPRGRTRLRLDAVYALFVVSIHASSREDATRCRFRPLLRGAFQSTRPRGRTRQPADNETGCHPCFNPRVLAGGRDL